MAKVTVTNNGYSIESLYKWDTGQELEIYGMTLGVTPEVHFAHKDDKLAIVRQASVDAAGVIRASIPDVLLQSSARICAYVCTQQGDEFKTHYKIVIPVINRARPSDYAPDEEAYVYALNNVGMELVTLEPGAAAKLEKVMEDGQLILRFSIPRTPTVAEVQEGVIRETMDEINAAAAAATEAAHRAQTAAAQSDWLAPEDEMSHVLNRTHHKLVKMEPFEVRAIDFIGDDVVYYDLSAILGERFTITRIKEETLTREQLEGAQVEYSSGDFSGYGGVEYNAEVSEMFSTMAGGTVEAYNYYTQRPSVAMDADFGFIFVFPADLEVPGFGTILKGTYLKPGNNIGLGASWEFKNEVYSPLEDDYIPPVEVREFLYSYLEGTDYDAYEVPVTVGGVWDRWAVNERFVNHLKQNKPVQITLNINDSAHYAVFMLHFPIRNNRAAIYNSLYMEQMIYSCELGVLFIEFKVESSQLTIKVDNLATKLGLA